MKTKSRKIVFAAAMSALVLASANCVKASASTFEIGENDFLLDGKPFVIRCAEMHFARVPKAYWRHRIQMVKAGGFNVICAYMFWNFHEPREGQFRFDGDRDVAEFCRIAQEEGMWVILRPGPYSCAEWEFGGLPWWLLKNEGIKLRSRDPRFLAPVRNYLKEVGRRLKANQITHGGNILMVQGENEYGFWGDDCEYMRTIHDTLREAGFDVPLFSCNPAYNLKKGRIPELYPVVNFGANPVNAFEKLREVLPTGPMMCGEFYPAWFDSWGEKHHVKSLSECINTLSWMLERHYSFSVYMAHGGTSFGWWAGCNAPFRPQTSSYDYEAPVSEAGWTTEKFFAMRDLFARHLNEGESIPSAPPPYPVQEKTVKAKPQAASFADANLRTVASQSPKTFEQLDFGYGYAVYRTKVPAGWGGDMTADVRDLGVVRIDGETVGFFDRRHPKASVKIKPSDEERELEIFVEQMGRYNFGQIMHESQKGIIGEVKLGGKTLKDWTIKFFSLEDDNLGVFAFGGEQSGVNGPCALKYEIDLEAKDTFLDMRDFKRGMVAVNGRWIGRYWSIGPTQTMYVPGCWLKDGKNEIVVIDDIGIAPPEELRFLSRPILGMNRPETDYWRASERKKLQAPLPSADIVNEGRFANTRAAQTIMFEKPRKGRYFTLEMLDSADGKQFAAGSELDLFDAQGRNIPHSKWTVAAVSSEERQGEDGSAENLVDGQTANHWHSEWYRRQRGYPHYVTLDLGGECEVGGMKWTPRQSDGPGRVSAYRAFVSESIPGL